MICRRSAEIRLEVGWDGELCEAGPAFQTFVALSVLIVDFGRSSDKKDSLLDLDDLAPGGLVG